MAPPAGAGAAITLALPPAGGGAQQSLVFGQFELKELEFDSCLALLEHLVSEQATARAAEGHRPNVTKSAGKGGRGKGAAWAAGG